MPTPMRAHLPIALLLAAVVAGALSVPVQPLYASSDSMAPAIETGDLYFLSEGGTVHTGDVIAFESPEHAALVTHRVVGEKAGGYVTKGDANPSTDQQSGHQVVARTAVVGTVIELNGRPVTVAGVGELAAGLVGFRLGVLALGGLILLALWARSLFWPERTVPARRIVYAGDVINPLLIGGVVVCLLFVLWGASTHELNYVASAGQVTAAHTVPVGEAVSRTVTVDTSHLPGTVVIVEAQGVTLLERTETATGLELLVEVPAKATTGLYQASVAVSTYPATLPRGAIEWLHGVHWLAAALGTIAPVYAPVYLVYLTLMDGRMPLRIPNVRWFRVGRS